MEQLVQKRYWKLKKHWPGVAILTMLAFLMLAPSCDRIEEAHGFLLSGKYAIGNGVLVGLQVEGRDRIAFLTCRHVVQDHMIETGRSFLDRAGEENRFA